MPNSPQLAVWEQLPSESSFEGRKKGQKLGQWGERRTFQIRGHVLAQTSVRADSNNAVSEKVYDLLGARVEAGQDLPSQTQMGCVAVITLAYRQHGRQAIEIMLDDVKARGELFAAVEKASRKIDVEERLVPLRTLGAGSWGKVMLMQDTRRSQNSRTPEVYAVKEIVLRKSTDISKFTAERTILGSLPSHRNVIGLWFAARRPGFLYYAMEFAAGGDLYSLFANKGSFCNEQQAKFYAAEMLLALNHLHAHNILYRDLKPENVLLSIDGHVKLGDFGLAKRVLPSEHTFTLCGTDPYVPPEMILGIAYREEADFWQFGCFLYELTRGRSPFYTSNKQRVTELILSGSYVKPASSSPAYQNLISQLLTIRNTDRLRSWEAVSRHEWFSSVDWLEAGEGSLTPPFLPSAPVPSLEDVSRHSDQSSDMRSETTSALSDLSSAGNFNMQDLDVTLRNFDPNAAYMSAEFGAKSAQSLLGEEIMSQYLLGFDWMAEALRNTQ